MSGKFNLTRSLSGAFRRGEAEFGLANLDTSVEAVSIADGKGTPWAGRRSGAIFESAWAHIFIWKSVWIARFHEYYDSGAIIDAIAA